MSSDGSHNQYAGAEKSLDKNVQHDDLAEVDAFIERMEFEHAATAKQPGIFRPTFKDPRHFTWTIAVFASMGGLLFGLDQSSISGANLTLPDDLGLDTRQQSLVNGLMPAGAVVGALLLSPANEYFGRRGAILLSILFYTIGAALEAGAINYGMILSGRLVLGLGIGIETGRAPPFARGSILR